MSMMGGANMPEGKTSAKSTRRERWAWYLYDFGNSAYAAVVLLAVYSAYFQDKVVGGAEGSRLWGIAVGIAMLVVAVLSSAPSRITLDQRKRHCYSLRSCLPRLPLLFFSYSRAMLR